MLFIVLLLAGHIAYGQDIIDSSIVNIQSLIYFDTDESTLKSDHQSQILDLLTKAKKYKNYELWVDTYTDDVGSASYNLALSERRKKSVVDYLIAQGVPSNVIQSDFHGETKCIGILPSNENRQLSRRAVLQLVTNRKLLYLKGTVIDDVSMEGVKAKVKLDTWGFKAEVQTDAEGRFKILAPLESKALIEITAEGYFFESTTLKISEKHKDIDMRVKLPKVVMGKKFKLKNMLFEGGYSIMLPKSYPSMDQLKVFMTSNSDICLEVAGHMNAPNSGKVAIVTNGYRLSVARALEVYDDLIKSGVAPERLLARGYGNWQMLYPTTTLESEMIENRRVEIVVSDCDSTRILINHEIPNRAYFSYIEPFKRYYSDDNYKKDYKDFPEKTQKDIMTQVTQMRENGRDPSQYKYGQLLTVLPDMPKPK